MPTPFSLFASAIPISSLKLAGIKHPTPYPFSSHSFSIPFPHLHGVSRVHAILHSFIYPLKPLTQASISIQPTKPVSLSKPSPTCGILLKKNAMWLSLSLAHDGPPYDARRSSFHPRENSVRPTFHFLRMSHIRNPIQPTFYLIRMSHIRNPVRPTFHILRMSHIRNPVWPTSTFSGCLTFGILFGRHSTFSGCLTSGILSG